ncbi:MAG: DUF4328 domain-containing protein [Myxococcales bacterium]|nr:DUF4328 domain-containing protein [Myxococcales bacterium]
MSDKTKQDNPYAAPSVAVDPPSSQQGSVQLAYGLGSYRSARGAAVVARVFLYINAVVAALSMSAAIWAASGGGRSYIAHMPKALLVYSLLIIVAVIARVACAIPFCIWFYRAYANLLGLGSDYTAFKLGWAPGSFFVPILNLIRPQQIAREIWMNSKNDEASTNWGIVNRWWGFWLGGNIISYIASRFTGNASMLNTGLWVGAFADLLLVAAAITGASMVARIEQRQSEMAAQLAARGHEAAASGAISG